MKPSLVLLDIDGVLLTGSKLGCFAAAAAVRDKHINPAAVYSQLFVPAAMRALKDVQDQMNGAVDWVVSSTWRESLSRSELCSVFRQSGLDFVADNLCAGERWRTPSKFGRSRRVDEIAQWLDRHHEGEPFAILDDTHSGASLIPTMDPSPMLSSNVPAMGHSRDVAGHPFAGRVVLCDENVGLTGDHVPFIVAALRRAVPVARVPA